MTLNQRQLSLIALPEIFAVCRLEPDALVPSWSMGAGVWSVTRTADELSVVCRQVLVPTGVRCERGWRCLRVSGTIVFTLVGVVSSLVAPLAAAGVSVFVISTFDTDYLLVKEGDFETAVACLGAAGHGFE